jgi:hypothetical protein
MSQAYYRTNENQQSSSKVGRTEEIAVLRPPAKTVEFIGVSLVPRAGLEPACGYPRWILSPLRLPFRHLGTVSRADELAWQLCQTGRRALK